MLISFSVENFRSIRDLQTFSMEEQRSDKHLEETNTFESGSRRLLKSAAIFGPNGSGKSNVLNALMLMGAFVRNSSARGQAGDKIPHFPFLLSTATENKPAHFEVEFFADGHEYRYGYEVTAERVVSEWLFRKQPDAKPARLFTRDDAGIDCSSEFFKEGKGLDVRTRPNALFLSVCAQFNGTESGKVMKWFNDHAIVTEETKDLLKIAAAGLIADPKGKPQMLELMRKANMCITDLRALPALIAGDKWISQKEELQAFFDRSKRTKIKTQHAKRDADGNIVGFVEFDMDADESRGTQRYTNIITVMLAALITGSRVVVMDELDASLHPLLAQAIVDLFHSPENKNNSQLIFTSHDVTLLEPERFRRDQIWFCEKDENEATELYSLAEFDTQDVRPTTKFSRQYLKGLFGAVPKLAQFREDLQNV